LSAIAKKNEWGKIIINLNTMGRRKV